MGAAGSERTPVPVTVMMARTALAGACGSAPEGLCNQDREALANGYVHPDPDEHVPDPPRLDEVARVTE
jgi:hypothetical protein